MELQPADLSNKPESNAQDYYCFTIIPEKGISSEILLAFLSDLPFESFEPTEQQILAYLPKKSCDTAFYTQLNDLHAQWSFSYTVSEIAAQNWNALWESNFQPIRIRNLCVIRADFHDPVDEVQHDIVINPRMAFGTGHHATTHLMIEAMEQLPLTNAKVLDYGCGTGILAILAVRLGAQEVQAVDIEHPAYENTVENVDRNGGGPIKALHGTLENISDSDFDIILANINRNVILESLSALYEQLKAGGYLVISGFLEEDESLMLQKLKATGFFAPIISRRNNWLCMTLKRV